MPAIKNASKRVAKSPAIPLDDTAATQLAGFLTKYAPDIASHAKATLVKMRKRMPHALELVYDNYNALAIGFSPTERASDGIVSIAVYPRWVSLFFLQARDLPDPDGVLKGSGSVAKHIVLTTASTFDEAPVQALLTAALQQAKVPLDNKTKHRLIIKSVSAKQRPRQ